MKNKKAIAIALSIGIILSCFSGLIVNYAQGDPLRISKNFSTKKPDGTDVVKSDIKEKKPTSEKYNISAGGETVYKGQKQSLNSKDAFSDDKYKLETSDIEKLIKNGHSLKDIFKADDIGNEINVDPKTLLERKSKEKKDLDTIKKEISEERKQQTYERLKKEYSKEYNELLKEDLSDEDRLNILSGISLYGTQSVKDLVKAYKKDGNQAIVNLSKEKKSAIPKQKLDKYGLSSSEIGNISEDVLDQIAQIAVQKKKPVKELVVKFVQAQSKMKGAK